MGEKKTRLQRAIDKGSDWTCAIRQVMLPKDTNMYGCVFGGVILSMIDLAAVVEARQHGVHRWVTASMQRVDFKRPISLGDTVSLYTRTAEEGTKSVIVEVCVEVHRHDTNDIEEVTTASVTMVSVDENGRSIPFRTPSTLNKAANVQ